MSEWKSLGPGQLLRGRVQQLDSLVEVYLAGELDLAGVGPLQSLVADLATRSSGDVILDLTDLTFVDCAGVRAISLATQFLSADWTRRVTVFNLHGPVRHTFTLTGVLHELNTV